MKNDDLKVIYITEKTATQSIISDIFTFGTLFGSFFINYSFLGDSLVLELFIVALILILMIGRKNKTVNVMTRDEALEFLNK